MGVPDFYISFLALAAALLGFLALLFYWLSQIRKPLVLTRLKQNPILQPIPEHWWESEAVFNPAALYDNGRVHVFYRAMGKDGISRVGYASSKDGVHFDVRLSEPVYAPPHEMIQSAAAFARGKTGKLSYETLTYDTIAFGSGGGWGGAEDPKVTRIGDMLYMTYVNNNGWEDIRIALTTISLEDFRNKNWNWSVPVFMSKRKERGGVNNKSGIILGEQVGGKHVIFHRIFPNIAIDVRDSLEFGEDKYLEAHFTIPVRKDKWDSYKLSMGSTPIRINEGWLAIFHATDERDYNYKIGAMILDVNDPSKVLYRSKDPILTPEMYYENNWKPGILYPSGAVVFGEDLLVYYGGGDKYVAVAKTNLRDFVRRLMSHEHAELTPVAL